MQTMPYRFLVSCLCVLSSAPAAWAQVEVPVAKGRKLAPDVLEVIEPAMEWGETSQGPVDLPLVAKHPELAWTPEFAPVSDTLLEKSKQVVFRVEVYCLEFAFKPVRMIEVDGKTVWYMLYRVRYEGGDLKPVPEPDNFNNEVYATPKAVSAEWVRFVPTFKLDTLNLNRVYMDQVSQRAKQAIAARERVGQPILDSVEMQRQKIKVSTATQDNSVWGVAMWPDVDPNTDFFTVEVSGLTNAQKLETDGDKTRYLQKTLVLHFFRPGDTYNELEDQIRFGIPALKDPDRQKYVLDQFGQQERLDYVWDYR